MYRASLGPEELRPSESKSRLGCSGRTRPPESPDSPRRELS